MSEQFSPEAYAEFYAESEEILQRVGTTLTNWGHPSQKVGLTELIDELYRDIHTVKGTSQLFGVHSMAQVAHVMEASLVPIRKFPEYLGVPLVDSLLSCLDLLDQILKAHKKNPNAEEVTSKQIEFHVANLIQAVTRNFKVDLNLRNEKLFSLNGKENIDMANMDEGPEETRVESSPILDPSDADEVNDQKLFKESVTMASQKNENNSVEKAETAKAKNSNAENSSAVSDSNTTIRVQVSLLDRLMNLIGEMVLVRNQVVQYSQKSDDFQLINLSQKLDLVTSELQEEVMRTRMQPIGSILTKFQRVVRDLARDLSKEMDLVIEGGDTELDKTLIEAIKDPLTHIVRNSCDHGIERPEDRKKAGKHVTGQIAIKAYQESGQVFVEISDDGKGLDKEKILAKALEKQLITQEKSETMSDRDIYQLIFAPGFSTAQQVSAVSGRGVGMDVVKTNIEKIGGSVELKSSVGKGSTIIMRIPLTLAIIPALVVRMQQERFAIPQVKLVELVRIESEDGAEKLEFLQDKPVFRLRGSLLPLVDLREVFNPGADTNSEQLKKDALNGINIVVLANESGPFGLIVEEILDTVDIVVKPLPSFFKKLNLYSGATITGDGNVALIMDVSGLARKANLTHGSTQKDEKIKQSNAFSDREVKELQELVSFDLNEEGKFTVPLCLVQRLEEFSSDMIEVSGKQKMVQYRDAILPIISLNDFLKFNSQAEKSVEEGPEKKSVIVVQKKGRLFGIEVNSINDIYTVKGDIENPVQDVPGILGNIIVGEQVSTVIDVLGIIDAVTGDRKESKKQASAKIAKRQRALRILFAEDTAFFVKQIKKILESNGLEVTHAENGAEAFKILQDSPDNHFDMVLSDIEMPKLNGYDLASKIRSEEKYKKLPLVALTTRFNDADIEKGQSVGFDHYLEKLKSDELLQVINEIEKKIA